MAEERGCGDCTACCDRWAPFVVRSKRLGRTLKRAYEPCSKLCDSGCSIYRARPRDCRGFTCEWRAGRFPLSPAEVGAYLEATTAVQSSHKQMNEALLRSTGASEVAWFRLQVVGDDPSPSMGDAVHMHLEALSRAPGNKSWVFGCSVTHSSLPRHEDGSQLVVAFAYHQGRRVGLTC